MENVVVAGAGFAGIQAALSLGRKEFNVELIDRDLKQVYTPGLIDLVRGRCSQKDLEIDTHSVFADSSVDLYEEEITDIRPEEKIVVGEQSHSYDYLILALGGNPIRPEGFEDVILPYTLDEAVELRNVDGKIAVVGSGYTGIEYACELAEKGLEVTLYDQLTRPLNRFPENVSERSLEMLYSKDIDFKGGKQIERIENGEVFYKEGSERFDQVVANLGVEPNRLIEESIGGIETNKGLSVIGYEDIFAVGDCNNLERKSAHESVIEAKKVVKNIQREAHEGIRPVKTGQSAVLVSMGSTGLYIREKTVIEARVFRYAKDIVRKAYIMNLKRQGWMLRNLM